MNAARLTLPAPGTELPHLGGSLGAYVAYPDGTTRALIVASRSNDKTGEWGEYGQDVPGARGIDGLASTNAMAEAGSGLAQAVRALTIGGHIDWYIPSRPELLALYEQAPQLFKDKVWHWSSTQYSRRRLVPGLRVRLQRRRLQGHPEPRPGCPQRSTSAPQRFTTSQQQRRRRRLARNSGSTGRRCSMTPQAIAALPTLALLQHWCADRKSVV